VKRTGQRRAQRETSAGGVVFRRVPPDAPGGGAGDVLYLLIRDSYGNWGFPKGHLEPHEPPDEAARREVAEETALDDLLLHGPIQVIDWYFRFRGKTIHKYCHFFLFESPSGEATPQVDEGITAVRWEPLDKTLEVLSYDNARGVLRRAAEMARCLVAVGRGRPAPRPEPLVVSADGGAKS
jgi:8-oxo-dGTP pyrophosphatase MutT (NUDIX family)